MRINKLSLVVVAAALVFSAARSMAQQQPPAAPPAAQQMSTASGELVQVDTAAKTLTIRNASGADMRFSYSDGTKVTGAVETVAGLATKSGTQVTVHYTKKGQENVASQIDVKKSAA